MIVLPPILMKGAAVCSAGRGFSSAARPRTGTTGTAIVTSTGTNAGTSTGDPGLGVVIAAIVLAGLAVAGILLWRANRG